MAKHLTAQPFTRVNWESYAGCERWLNGDQPIIRLLARGIDVVCDPEGLEVHIYSAEDRAETLQLTIRFPSQATATLFVNALPAFFSDPQTTCSALLGLGFKPV